MSTPTPPNAPPRELGERGYTAAATGVDVRSLDSTNSMAQAAVDAFGGIDILINNAAIMTDLPPYGLGNMPVDQWDRVMNVNLRGPLLCTQAVLPSMEARGGGRIVNGLSAGAFMPGGIYGVSKYALHGLTVNLASELGGRNINVNAIAPGLVDNESGYASLPKDSPFRDALAAAIPGKTSGPPEDLVGTLLLLCLACRRLDHGTDDPRRRRLDRPALTIARIAERGEPRRWSSAIARASSCVTLKPNAPDAPRSEERWSLSSLDLGLR